MAKNSKKTKEMSKFVVDKKELKSGTIPNPVVTGTMEAIGLKRINPIEIPKYLLMHPALPRGIEIKANRMIKLVDEDLDSNIILNRYKGEDSVTINGAEKKLKDIAEEALGYDKTILYDSGGALFLKQLAQGGYRFGTSFAVLQSNLAETEILRFEYQHPIFFGPAKYPKVLKGEGIDWGETPMTERVNLAGRMKIDIKTKKIAKYTQLTRKYPERQEDNFKVSNAEYVNTRTHPELKESSPGELVPVGREFDQDEVMQLMFDRIGDEPLGISLIQFLHLTIQYLLNMEKAGAQTLVNFGFNKWIANTPFKDPNKMRAFGQTLSNLQKDSIVILPKEIELRNIEPGTTEFDKVHPIYLKLIAMRLGIPIPLLTQDGTQTNKASIQEMRKDMYEDFIADELVIEMCINDGFFKSCQVKWPDLSIKEIGKIVPKFKFKQPPEDLGVEMDRDLKFSLMNRNDSMSVQMLTEVGAVDVANIIAERLKLNVMKNIELNYGKGINITQRKLISIKTDKEKQDKNTKDIDNQIKDIDKKKKTEETNQEQKKPEEIKKKKEEKPVKKNG